MKTREMPKSTPKQALDYIRVLEDRVKTLEKNLEGFGAKVDYEYVGISASTGGLDSYRTPFKSFKFTYIENGQKKWIEIVLSNGCADIHCHPGTLELRPQAGNHLHIMVENTLQSRSKT